MILKEIVDRTTKFFKDKNIESARFESELLISSALGLRRIDLYLKFEQPLKEDELEKCRDYVRRRVQGEPVAYILGSKDFYNLSFDVDPRVLIPRPETESMVEMALAWLKKTNKDHFRVLDLGCGSGCIGLTIAKNEPRAQVTLVDASEGAIQITRQNAEKFGVLEAVEIIHAKAQDIKVDGNTWDLILANPPYIAPEDSNVETNVKKFEPSSALFSGDEGLEDIKAWSKHFAGALGQPGLMIFEMGMTQGPAAKAFFESLNCFSQVKVERDLAGLDRFIIGENIE